LHLSVFSPPLQSSSTGEIEKPKKRRSDVMLVGRSELAGLCPSCFHSRYPYNDAPVWVSGQ
jgi:hypothetical protein